jgi:hypothetical protein
MSSIEALVLAGKGLNAFSVLLINFLLYFRHNSRWSQFDANVCSDCE